MPYGLREQDEIAVLLEYGGVRVVFLRSDARYGLMHGEPDCGEPSFPLAWRESERPCGMRSVHDREVAGAAYGEPQALPGLLVYAESLQGEHVPFAGEAHFLAQFPQGRGLGPFEFALASGARSSYELVLVRRCLMEDGYHAALHVVDDHPHFVLRLGLAIGRALRATFHGRGVEVRVEHLDGCVGYVEPRYGHATLR